MCVCVCVCTAFLFCLLLLSLCILERLQTFSAVAKSCLSLWRSEKYTFQILHSYSPSARVFEGFKMIEKSRSLKILQDLLFSFLFMSYGSIKILTSHFPRGASLHVCSLEILLCQVITICAAYTSAAYSYRPAENCSVGLRSWCNTYCLQPYIALFVFVFMAASTLHSSFFKGFIITSYLKCRFIIVHVIIIIYFTLKDSDDVNTQCDIKEKEPQATTKSI